LAPYRDLPQANLTNLSGRFVVEGNLMVERLAASRFEVESVVVDERRLNMVPRGLGEQVPVFVLPGGSVEQLIGFNFHRGILACGRRGAATTLDSLASAIPAHGLVVACVDVQDPTNLGGILRNCAAFGVAGVLLSRHCADAFSRRVLRVSMGTAFQLRLVRSQDLLADLHGLRDRQPIELVAAVLDPSAEPLPAARRAGRVVLLIGNEAHGLGSEWVAVCQRRVTLPMGHGTDSLNVSAASAVLLYHFTHVASGA
jgi:tRNA G18 (ribose-2'-O)-methylase SpoU